MMQSTLPNFILNSATTTSE